MVSLSPVHAQRGFTLVELAIVLMIIGLLIGGILRGQEIMRTARASATIKQVNSYVGALAGFRDRYSALPGDMRDALTRIPNCSTDTNCSNGNGNNLVGALTLFWAGGQSGINTENTQFWKHLSMAKFVSGVNIGAGATEWGESHPISPLSGGYTVITTQDGGEGSFASGTMILRLHGALNANAANIEEEPSASPFEARYIDTKMDDGLPATGNVRAKADGNGAAVANCEVRYDSSETKFCVMAFAMNI